MKGIKMLRSLILLVFVTILSINNSGCAAGLICLGAGAAVATVAVVQDSRNASEYADENQNKLK